MLLKFKKVYLRLCIKAQKSGIIYAEGRWSMKRKVYDKMLEWKAKYAGRYALMLDGARRVGKSWLAEEFAKAEYDSYVLIDFSKATVRTPVMSKTPSYFKYDLPSYFTAALENTPVKLEKKNCAVDTSSLQCFENFSDYAREIVWFGRRSQKLNVLESDKSCFTD